MKKLLIVIILCSSIFSAYSQVRIYAQSESDKSKDTPEETFNVSIRCYYTFTQINKKTEKVIRVDTMSLLIGDTQSKFYNPAKYSRDSIFSSVMNNMNPSTIQSISVLKDGSAGDLSSKPGTTTSTNSNDGESYQIFKDRTKSSISYIDYTETLRNSYGYEDKLNNMPWAISQDTASILGYPCQKATLSFRGREYVAWFSSDIPINDGPWKFMGLPGLILKINDTSNLFSFELIGIENIKEQLPVVISKAKFECNRKQFEGMKKKQGGGMQINVNGGNVLIAPSPGSLNYNPIELDLN